MKWAVLFQSMGLLMSSLLRRPKSTIRAMPLWPSWAQLTGTIGSGQHRQSSGTGPSSGYSYSYPGVYPRYLHFSGPQILFYYKWAEPQHLGRSVSFAHRKPQWLKTTQFLLLQISGSEVWNGSHWARIKLFWCPKTWERELFHCLCLVSRTLLVSSSNVSLGPSLSAISLIPSSDFFSQFCIPVWYHGLQ